MASASDVDRTQALAAVERTFSRFQERSALPRLRQRVTEAVGGGVDFAAYPILARIGAWGPLRTSELAERIGLDISTVSRRAADLEAAGLVAREPDPDDRRAHQLEVTTKGARLIGRMRKVRSGLLAEALESWTTVEIRELADILGRLSRALADLP